MNNDPEIRDPIAVFITAANLDEARRLAEMLVTSKLAACVQLLPAIESVYWWQGKIERSDEVLIIAKTARSKFSQLEGDVRASHSYETPEIVALPIIQGSEPYLDWLAKSVG